MKKIVLFDIDYTLFDTDLFKDSQLKTYKLYNEVEDVLKDLSQVAEIGIFSQGEDVFQKEKLKQTLIDSHFGEENVHIFALKDYNIGSVIEKYKDRSVFFVDDKLEVLKLAKDLNGDVFTIWIKRGPFAANQENITGFEPDAIIGNLSEVTPIINS
ncbi:MAG: hypothetical protein HYU48_02170 [Candidatus Levybacteria bacterium]|nr:hypothetical protein [Candidatus Levybacteria bacterium]